MGQRSGRSQGSQVSSRSRGLAILAFALGLLVASVASAPAASGGGTDQLPAGVTPADDGLIATKDSSPATAKLSSRLAALSTRDLRSASDRTQAEAVSLSAHGAGSLERDGDRLVVTARVSSTDGAVLDALRRAGGEILHVSPEYSTIDLAVDERDLRTIAAVDEVAAVTEALEPITGRVGAPAGATGDGAITNLNTCVGATTSEGDTQLRAADARGMFGVEGAGVKVGVISDSFDTATAAATRAAQDVASGDLPGPGNPCGRTTPVQVLSESPPPSSTDEGRAMVQIVHDLAPGAGLAFASRGTSAEAMADAIRNLRATGSRVIVDDILFFDEPMFQDGPISNAVNEVSAAGVPYFSSAANTNVIVGGNNISSYEAPAFRGAGSCSAFTTNCMDFNPGAGVDVTFGFTLNGGGSTRIDLQWAEPRNGVATDLDVYAFDFTAGAYIAQSIDSNPGPSGTQKPLELMSVQNTDTVPHQIGLVIDKFAGAANPRLKFVMLQSRRLSASEYPTSSGGDVVGPTIIGHSGAAGTISTAAVPFNNSGTVEDFSSRGPVTLYFGPVNGTTPAAPLAAPLVLQKPDVAATDGNRTTFFNPTATPGIYRFFGTSAAAPHAAAVAALQLHAAALTPADVLAAQKASATPIPGFGADAQGAGLINAAGAVGLHPPPAAGAIDTFFTKVPKNRIKHKRATYKIASNVAGATFQCKIDKRPFVACPAAVAVVHLKLGKHKFRARAVANGVTDTTPAVDTFKRKRRGGR